jgi:uncharacterized protein YhaN
MHHLYNYLKSSLTIPKVDDVISVHKKKYDEIHSELDKNKDELKLKIVILEEVKVWSKRIENFSTALDKINFIQEKKNLYN